MNKHMHPLPAFSPAILALCLTAVSPALSAQSNQHCGVLWACLGEPQEFSESKVIIEINATDGDAGFHAKFDGGAWAMVMMEDPDGNIIFSQEAIGSLADQGITENFFESAEPLCEMDEEEPDEEVVTLAEFLERFPEGEYSFAGFTIEDEFISGTAELTFNLPAAPDISATEDAEFGADETVVISWAAGDDLGEKCHDQSLIDDGTITDPADVEVVGWELVVEPDDEEAADPLRVYSVQLPPSQTAMSVPGGFFTQYLADGFNVFKFEVGAKEESGNQTFSEGVFEIECDTCESEDDD
jgi:hypothetical protein